MFDDVFLYCADVSTFRSLMVVAEENGYRWLSGDNPTKLIDAYADGMPAYFHLDSLGQLSFTDPDMAEVIIDALEYLVQFSDPPELEDLSILYG